MNILLSLLVGLSTIITTIPASNPDGKIMSPSESQSPELAPAPYRFYGWDANGNLLNSPIKNQKPNWVLPKGESEGVSYGEVVSRHEFGINNGIVPSHSASLLAVYRKDESRVSDFPLLDISTYTGSLKNIKYPMNGMPSELISLCICDTLGNIKANLNITDFDEERYLSNICWSEDDKYIFVQVIDRAQHNMHLNMYSAEDGSFVRTILTEHNDAWVEPLDPLYPLKGSPIYIYRTDNRDAYRSLYLCDLDGNIRRLTQCEADVNYLGNDGEWVYYTSAEVSPVENHLFRIKIKKAKSLDKYKFSAPERLTTEKAWHNVYLNPQCSKFLDIFSALDTPRKVSLHSSDGTLLEDLFTSPDPLESYARCEVEFGSVKAADGKTDNYYRFIKPLNYDPSKKYPLIVYVYGGPHSQLVRSSWLGNIRMWEMAMAQRGYAVYIQDNRGTSNRGAAFEKAINRQCGQVEMEDQMAGLNSLLERYSWIDKDRIGVHGWSYGGFMTISLLCNNPQIFKTAVAGGPVIDWKWYEVMYGERYMDTPQTNPEGFAKTTLLSKTKLVDGHKLLIIQGAIDDTVLWQHSLNFVDKCIEEEVQLDYFPYPTSLHNMTGKARLHLYEKITEYFLNYL